VVTLVFLDFFPGYGVPSFCGLVHSGPKLDQRDAWAQKSNAFRKHSVSFFTKYFNFFNEIYQYFFEGKDWFLKKICFWHHHNYFFKNSLINYLINETLTGYLINQSKNMFLRESFLILLLCKTSIDLRRMQLQMLDAILRLYLNLCLAGKCCMDFKPSKKMQASTPNISGME